MLNHIVLMGRLTRDPELRYTQSQIPVASFTLAVDRDFGRDGAERQTDFIDIVTWRKTAEFAAKHFGKGSSMAVSGRLQMRNWQDNNGNKRVSAEVIADNIYFAGSRRDAVTDNAEVNNAYDEKYGEVYSSAGGIDIAMSELGEADGDLPF